MALASERTQVGHTLVELMIVASVLIIFAVTTLSFATRQRAADRQHAVYAQDLLDSRAALSRIVADLRRAIAIESGPLETIIRTHGRTIRYRVENGRLIRACGTSRQHIAACIQHLTCRQQGRIAHVRLVLARRANGRPGREPAIQTSVALRLLAQRKTG